MRIVPTAGQTQLIQYDSSHPVNYVDISLESPDVQFEALTAVLEAADASRPAPFTGTPPFGEPTPTDEYLSDAEQSQAYAPAADMEADANTEVLSVISDAAPQQIPEWDWENDDQYFGLGVPPGVPNFGQPIESGHTQIVLPNPSAELGWDAWSGKPILARVARHENNFTRYNAGTSRGHGVRVVRYYEPYVLRTQQARDLLLAEIQRRGIHNIIVTDIPAVPYTEQVQAVDPSAFAPQPHIGEEGVLP